MHATISADLPFAQASELYISSRTFSASARARYVSPRTLKDMAGFAKPLNRFFGELRLDAIHIGHLESYKEQRCKGELGPPPDPMKPEAPKRMVGGNKVSQELGYLIRVMKRAHAWTPELEELYEPFQYEESDIPRAMSPREQEHLLEVAASRQGWEFVYWYIMIALRTTASNCELRKLLISDVNLYEGIIYIRRASSKNKYRMRTIPLAEDALWAAQRMLDRARALGAGNPQNCLMPLRPAPNTWDVTQPMTESGIKKPFDEIRRAAGLPWLRIHDLRHSSITRLAEAGTPIPVIMSMAGHISRKMLQHYTTISEQAKRMAVEAAFRPKRAVAQIPWQSQQA